MKLAPQFLFLVMMSVDLALGQTDASMVAPILQERIQASEVTVYQLRHYITERVNRLPSPRTADEWTKHAEQTRARLLNEVVFHGWPREWVDAKPKFQDLGSAGSGLGYRMRKLRYEILPGFQSTAILYEPEALRGKNPAILNVNGHVGPAGKAVEYKQKRCINQARQGILSLNLEWIGFGELSNHENDHYFAAHLDLIGVNGVGLFYLAMRRGLDYLYERSDVDRNRIGMTGLSGGGWQTIVLSALDERVHVAVPVAGYASFLSRLERMKDLGDVEQNATDMFSFIDYAHLTAMRAPRPTLLIYNAEDDCCFRAPMVKGLVFDAISPFFQLYGRAEDLSWHENLDPADHNYQLDNRIQSYRFFAKHFGLPDVQRESPADAEIKSPDELVVGVPKDNLTILKLARTISQRARDASANFEQPVATLRKIVRYKHANIEKAWISANTKRKGLETLSYRFEFDNGLGASAVWLKAMTTMSSSVATIVLADGGRSSTADIVSDRVNRGEEVLAADLLFTGDMAAPKTPGNDGFAQCLAALGERPLGLEVAQLVGLAEWVRRSSPAVSLRLEITGMRNEVVGLLAATLSPKLFAEMVIYDGISSLRYLLSAPIEYQQAPDLFCLDLLRGPDIPELERLVAPTRVTWHGVHAVHESMSVRSKAI
jgi:dienelactone hydrolase